MRMTTLCRRLALSTGLMLCLTFPATAKPSAARMIPAAQREIQAIYNKIDAALAQKDVDTFYDYNTEDCVFYDSKGHPENLEEGRQELVKLIEDNDTFQRTDSITGFAGSENEATVTIKCRVLQAISNNINGRAIKAVTNEVFRDYWVKTDNGWRRKRSRAIKRSAVVHKNF